MVKASAGKILFVTVIASLIGLPLFAQAQDKPLKKISSIYEEPGHNKNLEVNR